ncbi:MAG: hypothetical protein D8H97_16055 [Neisseria sp.]|nr:MAG: hypothetical protein D8H97_16055 [Neisseria sp.]
MAFFDEIVEIIYRLSSCIVVACIVFSIYEGFKPNGERISVMQRYFWICMPACGFVILHNILKG